MCVLVQIPEDQKAGPAFQVERLVHILLSLLVDAYQDQMEAVVEARNVCRAEEVVHIERVVAEGL